MKNICLFAVRAYQVLLGPVLGGSCRYYPSCSNYAVEAIERHGARHGSWLALRRLLRCHPFVAGGVDLVPDADERPTAKTAVTVVTKADQQGHNASPHSRREFAR
jgi:putative membrane protein insertion efficiency factor